MMKKIYLLSLLVLLVQSIQAQPSLLLLEQAYEQFEQGNYKAAAKQFERYFKKQSGQPEDYYLTAVAFAAQRNSKKALYYAEKGTSDIGMLGAMLADPQLAPIHPQLQQRLQALTHFYTLVDSSKYYRRADFLQKIDSLYRALPLKSVNSSTLASLSERFLAEKDTLQALYYTNEALMRQNLPDKIIERYLHKSINNYMRYHAPRYGEQLPFLTDYLTLYQKYQHAMGAKQADSIGVYLEAFFQKIPNQLVAAKERYNAACAFSLLGNFDKSANYLFAALEEGFEDLEHLFEDKDLFPLFQSPQGQAVLRYLLARYYAPAMIQADYIYSSSSQEYTEAKRHLYGYLKAKQFHHGLPKAFEVFSGTDSSALPQLLVPRFWGNELLETKFSYVFRLSEQGLLEVSKPQPSQQNMLVLVNKTADSTYADPAGTCYQFPLENRAFISQLRQGEVSLSRIPAIRNAYFSPLLQHRVEAFLISNPQDGQELYGLVLSLGVKKVYEALTSLVISATADNLTERTQQAYRAKAIHTAYIEKTIALLADTAAYSALSPLQQEDFRQGIRRLQDLVPLQKLDNRPSAEVASVVYPYGRAAVAERTYKAAMVKASQQYQQGWTNYKADNPYPLPEFHLQEPPAQEPLPENLTEFFFDPQTRQPIFYSELHKKILLNGKQHALDNRQQFLKGAVLNQSTYLFTPSHHTSPHDLLRLNQAKQTLLDQLQQLPKTLGLRTVERISTPNGGFNILYDRFYAFDAFGDVLSVWHNNDTLFYAPLPKKSTMPLKPRVLHATSPVNCSKQEEPVRETLYCLNSMQARQLDESLYLLYSASVSTEPRCSEHPYGRTFLARLDRDYRLQQLVSMPEHSPTGYRPDSNPNVQLVTTSNQLYAFTWPHCCGPQKGYYQVFDQALIPQSDLIEVSQQLGQKAMRMPPLAVCVQNNQVYAIYLVIENEEQFLKLEALSPKKETNRQLVLTRIGGVLLHNELIALSGNRLRYGYTEKVGEEYFYKSFDLDMDELTWQ